MKRTSLHALASTALLSLTAADPDGGISPCRKLDQRIEERQRFLQIRAQERLHYPTMPTFSPYCEAHPHDEDCQLLTGQSQQDLSRDVSEFERGPDGGAPVTDPVLVPLFRKRRELRCPKPE